MVKGQPVATIWSVISATGMPFTTTRVWVGMIWDGAP
jgi:hypothetical protein